MEVTRRSALQAGTAAVAAAALAGCRPLLRNVSAAEEITSIAVSKQPRLLRIVNRFGFGPRPGELAKIESEGLESFIERQLKGEESDPPYLSMEIGRMDAFAMDSMELRNISDAEVLRQLQQAALLRAVYSPNQFKERISEFWTNHFNIYAKKGFGTYRKGRDETEVVRNHALGSFPAMLRASAKSVAMLAYLDNDVNQKGVPNENYARELLELHSLGVDGGYSQKDIQELARCLTGWTIETGFLKPYGKLKFDPSLHDDGMKMVLGHRIPAGQQEKDIDLVLDILVEHPSTARFLAKKLCLYFIGSRSAQLESQIANAYLNSKGDIPSMLRVILKSDELVESEPILKRPFEFVVSALRVTDADTRALQGVQSHLRMMGQPSYEWPMPDGYPVDYASWSGTVLARWNFAYALMSGELGDAKPRLRQAMRNTKSEPFELLAQTTLGQSPDDPSLRELKSALGTLSDDDLEHAAALCLSSPQFQVK